MPVAAAVGTIGISLVGRLIGSGVQRLGSLAFQKIMRIAKIESALKGALAKNPLVQTAVSDFETVIGTRYGELNTELFEFLRELERSGIINSMVENALIGRNSAEVKQIFLKLHEKVIGPDLGRADLLFDKMMNSFSVTLNELSKDRTILDAFRLYRTDLEKRLDRVDSALIEVTKKLSKPEPPFESLLPVFVKIAKGLQTTYRAIRVETNKGARSVDITKIYIPPKLKYRDTKRNLERIASIKNILAKRTKGISRQEGFELTDEASVERLTSISYADLRLMFRHVVVLGDPGGGKSTLCQHLCHDLAQQALASLQVSESKQINAQLQKFPLRVILRTYEKARTKEPQLSIYEFILRELKNHVTADHEEIERALIYLLSSGSSVLAFDGLDEILATAQRREFVDLVVSFCNQFPLCPVIVTSRLVGYDDAHLPEEFDELILEKFEDEQVINYVTKFMKVVGGHDVKEAARLANVFYKQTTSNAADLRKNPLMLGLMAWLFNMRGDVPSNRPEIYRECAVLMFEKWDPDRDINADIPTSFDRLQLFSNLAAKIFGRPALSGGVEIEWLEKEIKNFFQEVYENKAQAYEAAKRLVKFITGRAWVMSEVGDKVFAFTHQTFLEYFFSRHIDEMHDTVKELFNEVIPRVARREWDMVAHLSLQIKTHRNLRRQNEALDQLRTFLLDTKDQKQKAALASFASRALEYLAGAESHIKPLVTDIIDYTFALNENDESQKWRDVSYCAQCSLERREFVHALIVNYFVAKFKRGEHLPVLVDSISISDDEFAMHHEEYQRLPIELSTKVREGLRPFVTERIAQSAFHAARAWEWYGMISKPLVSKHGIVTYFNTTLEGISGVDGLSSTMLCASSAYHNYFGDTISRRTAFDALSAFGAIGFLTFPFPKRLFITGKRNGPPLSVWDKCLKEMRSNPKALAGCLFAFMLVTEIEPPDDDLEDESNKQEPNVRNEIINRTVRTKEIQELNIYPQIKKAIELKTLFI